MGTPQSQYSTVRLLYGITTTTGMQCASTASSLEILAQPPQSLSIFPSNSGSCHFLLKAVVAHARSAVCFGWIRVWPTLRLQAGGPGDLHPAIQHWCLRPSYGHSEPCLRNRRDKRKQTPRSTISVDELLGQGILFSNPDSPVVHRRLSRRKRTKRCASWRPRRTWRREQCSREASSSRRIEDGKSPFQNSLVQERMDSCRKFIERARRRVTRAEEVIKKATEQKEAFLLEVQEAEHRLKQLELESAAWRWSSHIEAIPPMPTSDLQELEMWLSTSSEMHWSLRILQPLPGSARWWVRVPQHSRHSRQWCQWKAQRGQL